MTGRTRRVLHIVRAMNRGGVESWLMHVLRNIDPARLCMDFLVHSDQPAAFDAEIQQHNCRILRVSDPTWSPRYLTTVRRLLSSAPGYDVVHSHVHYFSGLLLRVAQWSGIPIRIAHSHSDTSAQDAAAAWFRRGYLRQSRSWIRRHATNMVAASQQAGHSLFGPGWLQDRRSKVLHCGIDFASFQRMRSSDDVRKELGIDADANVLGHVGRFDVPKNHTFLLEIAAEVIQREPAACLLLVGDGPLRPAVLEQARRLGISDRVVVAGMRSDVPDLLAAMDLFVFPSLYEGLPLTVLEAQATGVPCILSDVISNEVDVVPGLIQRVPLNAPAAQWVEAVLRRVAMPPNSVGSLGLLQKSSFDIRRSIEGLYELYA